MDYFITATVYGLNNNVAESTVCLGLFLSFSNIRIGFNSYRAVFCNLIQYIWMFSYRDLESGNNEHSFLGMEIRIEGNHASRYFFVQLFGCNILGNLNYLNDSSTSLDISEEFV